MKRLKRSKSETCVSHGKDSMDWWAGLMDAAHVRASLIRYVLFFLPFFVSFFLPPKKRNPRISLSRREHVSIWELYGHSSRIARARSRCQGRVSEHIVFCTRGSSKSGPVDLSEYERGDCCVLQPRRIQYGHQRGRGQLRTCLTHFSKLAI